jgi:integrase
MPAEQRGAIYTTRDGVGIRWREGGQRVHRSGFRNKTEARRWFADYVSPRLRRGAPSSEITYDAFCDVFLERHGPTVALSTKATLEERLASSRQRFGSWTLRELEGAAADIAKWRAELPPSSRYRLTSAFRQALGAAVRWDFIGRNPAVEAGRNPQPRSEELRPFAPEEIDALALELGNVYGPLVVIAVETGLRPEEWVALERRDVDMAGQALTVQRKFANGVLTPYPKTNRSRRRVPLTSRAVDVVEALPPRLDTKLVFPASEGGYIGLDTWRTREWYPALEAAGIEQRGPYCLRHTFATEALAAGVSTFELSRVMGTSVAMIDQRYGHLARDSEASIRARLEARANRLGVEWAPGADGDVEP